MCKPVLAVLVLTAHCSLSGISAASSSRAQNKRNAHDNIKETPSKLVHTTVSPLVRRRMRYTALPTQEWGAT